MLAAENPAVDGHLSASTPRRRGMDCKSSNNAKGKLVQARLPFKRLNSGPKENQPPKRPCAHDCPKPEDPDRENENESSPLPMHSGPPLINGRGPLDGFLCRRRPAPSDENNIIDLTEDSPSLPTECLVSSAPASSPIAKDKHQGKDKIASSGKSSNIDHTLKTHTLNCTVVSNEEDMDEDDGNQTASISLLDATQNSESEPGEQDESGNVSSLGNRSMLSASSVSATSDSSPEKSKADDPTPTSTPTEPKTTPKIPSNQKNIRRRSLKNEQEKLRQQQEKERQKEEAKAAREKKKEEARKLKDEQEREKREKKEKQEREKKEKEKEKADKLKAKEELRKSKLEAKLEEKRKKEEEKQMKEEEKRLKEEKDRLKAEKAEITRFLQKPKVQQAPKTLAAACGKFAPFEIKEHMALAPLCRVQCEDSVFEELDRYLLNPAKNLNGLKDWIGPKPRSSGRTNPRQTDEHCECISEGPTSGERPDRKRYGPMKLLQFHANYRPAYWGTWSKKSSHISPRCPFKQDKDLLDYEVDSDEEWEEEEPGESLSHSEGEDEEEGGEDDDDDDGFFVPHGYLSDDEGAPEEEECGDPEKQKLRQRMKAKEWDELMSTKKKMKVLDPVVRGCVWEGEGPALQLFQSYAICLVEPLPSANTSPSPDVLSQRHQKEAQLLSQLLPLLHGNFNSSKVIITEFQEFCRQQTSSSSSSSSPGLSSPQSPGENIPTRMQIKRLIKSNAVYEKRSSYRRCWYVHTEVLSRCGQEALPVPCQWTYLTTGAREESREEPQAATGSQGNSPTTPQTSSTPSSSSNKRKSTGSMSITKFMKRCTDPEQTEAMEADGFQADTEEDDEEDCIIISTQSGPTRKTSSDEADCLMEVTPSSTAALPVASSAPSLTTA